MDDHTDDRNPGVPPVGSPEELEEALKWLEELTARQGKTADLPNPVPPTSLDSPFRGLIDNDEGDLPDWLREVPTPAETETYGEDEPESRLDWLAKMAQRESIEELPTLEWRRLSEPVQSAILPIPQLDLPVEDLEMDAAEPAQETTVESGEATMEILEAGEAATAELMEPPTDEAPAEVVLVDEILDTEMLVSGESAIETEGAAETPDFAEEPATPIETHALADLSDSLALSEDEELPPLDDLDAAMAWIEELAASQDAPIEDVPSVADRALASKLMMEAGLSPLVSPLDELGSDSELIESLTPTHPFIEEEDFADTVVLVETMAAEQGIDMEPLVPGETTPFEAKTDELSFDEAMAFLDELAVAAEAEVSPAEAGNAVEEAPAAVAPPDDGADVTTAGVMWSREAKAADTDAPEPVAISAEDTPWSEDASESAAPVVVASVAAAAHDELSGSDVEPEYASPPDDTPSAAPDLPVTPVTLVDTTRDEAELETTLSELDALALPPGKSLADIDAALRNADATPGRDVMAALAWLESALTPANGVAPTSTVGLDEEALIAQMPDDPDAVLAWLEQIAAEESSPTAVDRALEAPDLPPAPALFTEPPGEADLLNMPEDPDEAMAWLEGLARSGEALVVEPSAAAPEPVAELPPAEEKAAMDATITEVAVPATAERYEEPPAPKPARRRRSKPQVEDTAPASEPATPPEPPAALESVAPPREQSRPATDWVDLLKPLE